MIEKCSIGNMSYNIQNITLIILILILIIVIIYYLKNSSAKHNELIEKYTTPTTTDANVNNTTSYTQHYSLANSLKTSQFPTSEAVVTLRPCQVHFNNTFDDSGTGTHKYFYEDGWQEIETLKETSTSTANRIPNKIISAYNETNKDDVINGKGIFTNYSEQSKCFKNISGTDNKYRYQGNNLINYITSNHVELKLSENGMPQQYMQMAFNLLPANSSTYYNNLKESICSLRYAETVTDLSGDLVRLTLDNNNIITDIDGVTVNATNNHIFNINDAFTISSLITSVNSGTYRYNEGLQLYQYVTTNSASSGLITTINLYKFDRNLLCDKTSGTTTYQDIKTYRKLSDAKIDVSQLINFNLPPTNTIRNTGLPSAYKDYYIGGSKINITTGDFTKDTLTTNINRIIDNELVDINRVTNRDIDTKKNEKTNLEKTRDDFVGANNTKQIFINNAIIKTNYDNAALKYNLLLNTQYYNLKLNEVKYFNESIDPNNANIQIISTNEPTFKELLSAGEKEVYETLKFTHSEKDENQTYYNYNFQQETICDILIVGGGGAGGNSMGGGGGAGGVVYTINQTLQAGNYTIGVGKGGIGKIIPEGTGQGTYDSRDQNGQDSFIQLNGIDVSMSMGGANQLLRGYGGGGGGVYHNPRTAPGFNGGSGGGCSETNDNGFAINTAGSATQGNTLWDGARYVAGGKAGRQNTTTTNDYQGGGGGGAGNINSTDATNGTDGVAINITGNSVIYAAGGGSSQYQFNLNTTNKGLGGSNGVGGNGRIRGSDSQGYLREATSGTDGTGSGGGGGSYVQEPDLPSGSGGSGIVIIRYKNVAKMQINNASKKITFKNERSFIHIYKKDTELILNSLTMADILVVGGGGGGGSRHGGGGGGGSVIYLTNQRLDMGTYKIMVGIGGGGGAENADQGYKGGDSSISLGTTTKYLAKGGGGGYFWYTYTNGNGGSGGGGGAERGSAVDTNIPSGTYGTSGCIAAGGGPPHTWAGGGGGGASTTERCTNGSGNVAQAGNGGNGLQISISGEPKYYGGGGGGGTYDHPDNKAGNGGLGGGGNGSKGYVNASNGLPNTGGGGGGGGFSSNNGRGGYGGSGIVIIKYNNTNIKSYIMRVSVRTYFTIIGGGITKTLFLHGAYKIIITATTSTLMKYTTNIPGITTLDIVGAINGELTFNSNEIDIIYDLFKSINEINNTDYQTIPSTVANIYTGINAIPYNNTKYNRYKISTNISKIYKTTRVVSGVNIDDVNFNIEIYSNTGVLINSDNYSIRYKYSQTVLSSDVIIPLDIYLTIKPIDGAYAYNSFIIKTHSRRANGTNETEIYAFIGNGTGASGSVSINNFNNINNFTTSLTEQDVWDIVAKQGEINVLNAAVVNLNNIASKCSNNQTTTTKICDVNTLIAIKGAINGATETASSPSFKDNISISSSGLFPTSQVLNYSITDYISYESSTQRAPANRITTFNILDSASKYIYFAIP